MIEVAEGSASNIPGIMPIMVDAFDPAYGEAWTSSQCLSALAMPGCRLMLATESDVICGFAMSRWVLDTEELLMIAVARNTQRKKIGTRLLTEIIKLARAEGRTQLFLEVRDGNRAHDFYRNIGFRPIGRRKEYYTSADGVRLDAITMSYEL